ncbi:GNAT family N-acetyltransferase [Teichococcus oryzae]|uniref:N-acetyltransferase family protein n=1 Tax=Teichococcus oryzae TaxID=1608942 RepID=A0A5B2TK50_9PROT|nr:GNAT family N-acetyltransferase [Pseudoroseomonas oryzae]KAA2214385.1 N-acetyltransferase family protein [Pseudoroseomonas oryzae]
MTTARFLIRDATEPDLPRILAIFNEAIRTSTAVWHLEETSLEARRAWLLERQGRGLPVLVAEQDGVVQGFASYGDFRPFAGYARTVEHSLYVDRAVRGQGFGHALLAALLAHAGQAGLHVIVAGIEANNAPSIALHRKAGFREAGCLRQVGRKFDRWLDLLLMQKILSPDGGAPAG